MGGRGGGHEGTPAVPTHTLIHGIRGVRGFGDGQHFSFVISLMRFTFLGDRPGRRAKGC